MPAVSAKQKKFMDAAAHNPEFAKKAGIPTDVAQEFSEASKGKKFGTGSRADLQGVNKQKTDHGSMNFFKKGGAMKSDMKEDMKMDKSQDKAMIKKAFKQHDAQEHKGGKGTKLALKKGGMSSAMMDKAGRAMASPSPDMMGRAMAKRPMAAAPAAPMMKKGGMTKMAKGGGIESKGKTKGKMITMNRGGKAC
jgi:hypothetical protein